MTELIRTIEAIRGKLDAFRRKNLKETPTRTIIIDPMLQALGWDVRDPDEVELEYPTVDGKSVDYALKLNRRPVLLVEAKALNDPLNDVKATTQVVGYAANAGIVWCILTNGLNWKVYRSVEKCEAPDKLMYEVALDPSQSEGHAVGHLAEQMWRFSRESMAKGTLDAVGERTFLDGKVRKALEALVSDPPRYLLNGIRERIGDRTLRPAKVKESLARVWSGFGLTKPVERSASVVRRVGQHQPRSTVSHRAAVATKARTRYDEDHHTSGKPQQVIELYRAVDRLCLSLAPGGVDKRYMAKTVNYVVGKRIFCSVHLQRGGLRVWLGLKYGSLQRPPDFARDVSAIGHWGAGDLELDLSSMDEVRRAADIIRQSFEIVA